MDGAEDLFAMVFEQFSKGNSSSSTLSGCYQLLLETPIEGFSIASQYIANKFFDIAVNSGVVEATKIVQRAVNALVGQLQFGIQVDGKVGLQTLDAINQSSAGDLMVKIREYGKDFYDSVLRSKPEDKPYYDGWMARLES